MNTSTTRGGEITSTARSRNCSRSARCNIVTSPITPPNGTSPFRSPARIEQRRTTLQPRTRYFADRVLAWAYQHGVTGRVMNVRRQLLTIVCYHRVEELAPGCFQGFLENISASPENFERQIRYLRDHFDPISASELGCFISNRG